MCFLSLTLEKNGDINASSPSVVYLKCDLEVYFLLSQIPHFFFNMYFDTTLSIVQIVQVIVDAHS